MTPDQLLQKATQFERLAQQRVPKKPSFGGVLNIARQTLKGIVEHPSIVPQAIDTVWDHFVQGVRWHLLTPTQQAEINRKILIAKKKQVDDMKRQLMELSYELGQEMTLAGQENQNE
jgi:hypothetical protein